MPDDIPTQRNIKNVPAADYTSIYSNNVAVSLNFFDMSLIFGEMVSVEAEVLTVEQKIRVVMPPSNAKLFLLLLMQQLQQYEERFGHINLPADIVQPDLKPLLELAGG